MYKLKIKISEHWLITLLCALRLNMGQWSGALRKETTDNIEMVQRRAARWVSDDYCTYSSVTEMMSNLGWRSLENRRYDAHLLMFYKIVYGLVVIPVPSYFESSESHTTSWLSDRFTLLSVTINSRFPHDWFCWINYQLISSSNLILTPSKQESERSIMHTHSKTIYCF